MIRLCVIACALSFALRVGMAAQLDEVFGDDLEGFVYQPCDNGLASNSSDAKQFAAALDICSMVTQESGKPGLIDAQFTLPSGLGVPDAVSHAIRPTFGTNDGARYGASMAVLSTGAAAAVGQTNPSYVAFDPGDSVGTSSDVPADWLTANQGAIPTAPGCPPAADTTAHDSVMLTLTLRVPGAAHSFSLEGNFLTADYPEYVCNPYNDVFVALLDSVYQGSPTNPADKNIAEYPDPPIHFPMGVGLAKGDTGYFTQCINGNMGCGNGSGFMGSMNTCIGTSDLAGTGMDLTTTGCAQGSNQVGGGTGWLLMRGNVVPGEIIQLRLAIWDVGDGTYDSLVLLDHFKWSTQNVAPGLALE